MAGISWRRQRVGGWGMAVCGEAEVARPTADEQVLEALSAGADGRGIALRGSGCSYGDAAMNTGGRVLDLSRMNRILSFDVESGIARVEPGVTIRDLWRRSIQDAWWPPVVPGTQDVSVGGAAAMNIHGKNNFAVGPFGEHVRAFRLATPSGEILECDRERNADVFHAAISGFGMLGCFVELELELKKVHSGRLRVWGIPARTLDDNLELLEGCRGRADYLVGWLDLHARGAELGRGTMHRADLLAPGEDPPGEQLLDPTRQDLPATLLKVVPKSWIWPGMWFAFHFGGVPLVNSLKYRAGFKEGRRSPCLQAHCAFHFLLDYVPRWHWMTKPGGLIQFQPFVPREHASRVLRALILACHEARVVPYLGVLKRHRPDPFLMTHAVDGYSLAMDFGVPKSRAGRERLWRLTRRLAEVVLDAGGRFYYAKDATLCGSSFDRIHGGEAVAAFRALKQRLDPEGVLQTDLSRRMLG